MTINFLQKEIKSWQRKCIPLKGNDFLSKEILLLSKEMIYSQRKLITVKGKDIRSKGMNYGQRKRFPVIEKKIKGNNFSLDR
jgi:hypothetical protein